jgi:hypothetical protein
MAVCILLSSFGNAILTHYTARRVGTYQQRETLPFLPFSFTVYLCTPFYLISISIIPVIIVNYLEDLPDATFWKATVVCAALAAVLTAIVDVGTTLLQCWGCAHFRQLCSSILLYQGILSDVWMQFTILALIGANLGPFVPLFIQIARE